VAAVAAPGSPIVVLSRPWWEIDPMTRVSASKRLGSIGIALVVQLSLVGAVIATLPASS
jgi:hypothetical protein